MPEVADVLRRYGTDYRERFGEDLLPSHRRAMDDILRCRTEALGGQLLQCDHCGQEHYVYHSCRNRSCPKCHRLDTEAWLAERRQELLPVPYFHVVFTLPQELRVLVRRHQNDLYDILLRAAAQALIQLAADPHYVGGLIGVLCVLHTWTRTLAYHHQLQLWLTGHVPDPPPTSPTPESPSTASWATPLRAGQTCPSREQDLLVVIRSIPRPPRGPP